jgi:hypothetical protein
MNTASRIEFEDLKEEEITCEKDDGRIQAVEL